MAVYDLLHHLLLPEEWDACLYSITTALLNSAMAPLVLKASQQTPAPVALVMSVLYSVLFAIASDCTLVY